jgi:hypothetical protein
MKAVNADHKTHFTIGGFEPLASGSVAARVEQSQDGGHQQSKNRQPPLRIVYKRNLDSRAFTNLNC